MAKTEHYYTKFEEDKFYHVYNRSVNRCPMFCNDGNHKYFLKRYDDYLSPVLSTYAYCLLGNHFHLLIRIHNTSDLSTFQKTTNPMNLKPTKSTHDIVSHQFRKFFQSYAMAFNKQQNRIGTLFQTPFKRALVNEDNYFTQLIYYIHTNPQSHRLIDDFRNWKWSSYKPLMNDRTGRLKKQEVLYWFGGLEKYKQYHSYYHQLVRNETMIFEDD